MSHPAATSSGFIKLFTLLDRVNLNLKFEKNCQKFLKRNFDNLLQFLSVWAHRTCVQSLVRIVQKLEEEKQSVTTARHKSPRL